jgi:hypothetical protein
MPSQEPRKNAISPVIVTAPSEAAIREVGTGQRHRQVGTRLVETRCVHAALQFLWEPGDVRMIEAGDCPRFALEPLSKCGIRGDM